MQGMGSKMGIKRASYSNGDLAVIWPDGRAPRIEDATLRRIYTHVFAPALKADILRLHAVMLKSLQPLDGPNFDSYTNGLATLKASIGISAIPDIETVEGELGAFHKKFLAGKIRDFEWDIMDIVESRKVGQIATGHHDFLDTRYRCIGFDTSTALREIAAYMRSDKGRAELYVATMQGRGPLKDLLTVEWVNARRSTDITSLRERMHDCTAKLQMAQRIAHAKQHDTSKPRLDDIDEAIRVNNLRVVAGTAYTAT